MQKVRVPINSFQFGEVSESLLMRTDTPVYNSSAQSLENMIVLSEGAVKKRDGLKHIYRYSGITFDPDHPAQSHLFKFQFSDDEQYLISVEHQRVRCFLLDGNVTLVSTITADTNADPLPFDQDYLREYNVAQYGDVMFICHPLFMPRMLIRTGLTSFEVTPFSFDQRRDGHVTYQPYNSFQATGVTIDASAASGSVNLDTSVPYWTPDHVGVVILYGNMSEVLITSYVSPTRVVGTVIDGNLRVRLATLNPLRTNDHSDIVEVTHLQHGFAGGETIVILNASAVGGIAANKLNGSRIIASIIDENTYTFTAGGSASSAEDGGGYVTIESHAPTTDWAEQSFSAVRGYPQAVAFHENRLCFGGTLAEPDTIWMSAIGDFFNFYVGEAEDNQAITLTAATGTVNEIRYMVSNRDLQIFTAGAELYVPTFLNQSITPTNAQIRQQTPYGCDYVQPVSIDGATIFVQKGGNVVREYLYTDSENAYTSTAISTIATHLITSPNCMTVCHGGFQTAESYSAMSNGNGDIALFSSNRAERRAAWTRITTPNGSFCSVCAIHDRLFANVWGDNGNMYLCEFVGQIGLDRYDYNAIGTNNIGRLDVRDAFSIVDGYPVGTLLDVIAVNGSTQAYLGRFPIVTDFGGNAIDLRAYPGYTHAYFGLAFTAKVITNPIDGSLATGPATGDVRGISAAVVDLRGTTSVKVNGFGSRSNANLNGKTEFRILGYGRDPQVTIEQDEPMPLQVNGIVAELIV